MNDRFDYDYHDYDRFGNGNNFNINQEPAKKPGRKKRNRKSGHWTKTIASALVFGLIAGTVTYGVNTAESKAAGYSTEAEAQTDESTNQKTALTTASKDSDSTTVKTTEVSATDGDLTVAQVAENVMPSMVTISTVSVQEMQDIFGGVQQYEAQGAGTGVIIGKNDTELLIATNNHVVDGATEMSVGFSDETAVAGTIKGTDSDNDLAVVAVKLSDIPDDTMSQIKIATIGDSDSLELGDQVVAIGNALGYGQSVTSGYVSALNRSINISSTQTSDGLIQTDAAINAGNSGGGLFNMQGELIGINEAKSSSSAGEASVDNIGFAIPMSKAQSILTELMNETTRETVDSDQQGFLGINCADVSATMAQMYSMPEGICVTSVEQGSAAGQAGIQKGDIIKSFDGKDVSTTEELQQLLTKYKSGETVKLTLERANNGSYEEQTVTVTLGSKSDQ